MAENSAIVAEYSEKKKKLWLRIQQLWPSIRQEKKRNVAENSARLWPRFRQEKELWLSIQQNCGRGFGKRKRNMAEVSANSRGCQFDKQT